jgi:alkylation response protein AidB-like acyl-CoA dehydrogenase
MTTGPAVDWKENLARVAPTFAERAAAYDDTDAFVAENYADIRSAKLFSALVPQELGGSGLPYREVCALIRGLAHHCGSTALAFSMHQHLAGTADSSVTVSRSGHLVELMRLRNSVSSASGTFT